MIRDYQNLSDEKIVQLIKEGDVDLFRILYDRYCGYIKYILNGIANIPNRIYEPEDLLADVMTKIFENIGNYRPQKASFKTWIVRIATNHALDVVRKKQITVVSCDSGNDDEEKTPLVDRISSKEITPLSSVIIKDLTNIVLMTIEGMKTELLKTYMILKFVFTFSDEEIADFLGVSESTVRSNTTRALYEFGDIYSNDKNNSYKEVDINQLKPAIKEGFLFITEDQLDRIENKKMKIAIKSLCFEKRSVDEVIAEQGISSEEIHSIVKYAIGELLRKGLKRGVRKMEEEQGELSDKETKIISDYISTVLRHKKVPDTRGKLESSKIAKVKAIVDLLVLATDPLRSTKSNSYSLGTLLLLRAKQEKLSLNELSKRLKLDIHQLSEILNNKLSDTMRKDERFIQKISIFLNMSVKDVKTIISVSRPPVLSTVTRQLRDTNSECHKKNKNEIYEMLARKYSKPTL